MNVLYFKVAIGQDVFNYKFVRISIVNYDNKNESTEKRARAWLEINCAHCHRPDGPGQKQVDCI